MAKYTPAPIPENEQERLQALYQLNLLDTPPEKRFDQITKLALTIFHVPISTVTLVDSHREWFKSCQGLPTRQGERAISFCGHAVLEEDVFLVPDTLKDPRFAGNPMVTGKPFIRFYAGMPLRSADGNKVGVFCIKDRKPRILSDKQIEQLRYLAAWVEIELNLHELGRALTARQRAEQKVSQLNERLKLLNKILRHDMLNNLTAMQINIQLFLRGRDSRKDIETIAASVRRSIDLIQQSKDLESAIIMDAPLKKYDLKKVSQDLAGQFPQLTIDISGEGVILADEALNSLIENIIKNAQIHGGTEKIFIHIQTKEKFVELSLADTGKGIPNKIKGKIFQEGFKYGKTGQTGLGLFIVKNIVSRYNGDIKVKDNIPNGTVFIIRFPLPRTQ